jgi:Tfp pilus assembly major pilin PilA
MELGSKKHQRGVSLIGLIVVLAVVGVIGVTAMKIFPTVNEYYAIKRAVTSAKAAGSTPADIRMAFNRQAEVGYIDSIQGKDLEIAPGPNGMTVSFAYQKVIPLVGPASLLLDYHGSTLPAAAAATTQ